jgi:hypothetical protein
VTGGKAGVPGAYDDGADALDGAALRRRRP